MDGEAGRPEKKGACRSGIGLAAGSSAALVASRAVEGIALTILATCGPLVVRACVDPGKVGTAMGVMDTVQGVGQFLERSSSRCSSARP